ASPIILDADRPFGVQCDEDSVAMPGECFVDRIVADLEHHVMQAGPVIGVADVHAGAFPHRIQPFEDLDAVVAVTVAVGAVLGFLAHTRAYRESGRETKAKHAFFRLAMARSITG